MSTWHIVLTFVPGVLLLISEVLPFVKNPKANGILQFVISLLKKVPTPPSDPHA